MLQALTLRVTSLEVSLEKMRETLAKKEEATIRPIDVSRTIQIANGVITVHEEAQIYIHELGIKVWAGLAEDSPAVLSLGLLCDDHNFIYVWKPNSQPILQKGNESNMR